MTGRAKKIAGGCAQIILLSLVVFTFLVQAIPVLRRGKNKLNIVLCV